MTNHAISCSELASIRDPNSHYVRGPEADSAASYDVTHPTGGPSRNGETPVSGPMDFKSEDFSQTHFRTQELQAGLPLDREFKTENSQAPHTTASHHAGAAGTSNLLRAHGTSTAKYNSPPAGVANSNLEDLQRSQETIPTNTNAIRRLPLRSDFDAAVDLEVVQPLSDQPIKFAIVMLQDRSAAKRSLEYLARCLQQQYPEVAFIIVRCPDMGKDMDGWAGPYDDQDFVSTSRMLLIDIIRHSLIYRCGFKTKQIVILGHGQGGTAALIAVSRWDTVQFAGVVSIGGPMSARLAPSERVRCKTPALLLGCMSQSNDNLWSQRVNEFFIQTTYSTGIGTRESDLEASGPLRKTLEHIAEFFAHRLRREEWTKQAIISFDGGGIRGYGSLLILKELMNKIGDEEKRSNLEGGAAHSSFFPCLFRPIKAEPGQKVSPSATPLHPVRSSESSESSIVVASSCANLPNSSLFYPCHYFTYAAGTSTGGLISIMLSRLRMSVDECIAEYKSLGQKVFGHPRPLCKGGFPWHKFDCKALEEVVESVTARYGEESEFGIDFRSDEDFMRTIVLAYANISEGEAPHIFRTFDTPPSRLDRSRSIYRQRDRRNQGPAPRLSLCQVARATSAAPGYFPPIKINKGSGQSPRDVILFKDGGFGANNPSKEALGCVVYKHGGSIRNIGPFVSIGTGAHSEPIFAKKPGNWQNFKANLKGAVAHPAKTKGTHEDMAYISNLDGREFPYYRFEGGEDLGKIALDEWKSNNFAQIRGKNSTPGYKTIDTMDQATSKYILRDDVQDDLKKIASILVKRRRLRVRDTSAWDRYASASYYECIHKGCEHRRIATSDLYKEHLRELHGLRLPAEVLERDMLRSRRCWLYKNKPSENMKPASTNKDGRPSPPIAAMATGALSTETAEDVHGS